jgi:DNA (cytosine-5)-methyltransferase 1
MDEISVPYNRNGTGNFFIITHKLEHSAHGQKLYVPLETAPTTIRQGFAPKRPIPQDRKLRGLDLFCGSGNFGRGLEEGGVVDI